MPNCFFCFVSFLISLLYPSTRLGLFTRDERPFFPSCTFLIFFINFFSFCLGFWKYVVG